MLLSCTNGGVYSKVCCMDRTTAHILNSINGRFYDQCAGSFSATRRNSWAGWEQALTVAGASKAPRRVLDVACGNLRFEEFLTQRWPDANMHATCIDASLPLMDARWLGEHPNLKLVTAQEDIVSRLVDEGNTLEAASESYDLIACIGFMHHVPGAGTRAALLHRMGELLAPGGILVVSFWQFLTSDRLARQAEELTAVTCKENGIKPSKLDAGDCFLGWQNLPDARRYCHSFTQDEVKQLAAAAVPAAKHELSFFECDGRNGRMNRYLVAKRIS